MVAAPDESTSDEGLGSCSGASTWVVVPVVVSEQSHRPMVATPDQGPGVVALVVVSEQSLRPMVATPDLDHCPPSTFEMLDALPSSPRSMS